MPEIVSGTAPGVTAMEKPGRATEESAALNAKIAILEFVSTTVGVPLSRPVVVENAAHDGLFKIANLVAPVAVG